MGILISMSSCPFCHSGNNTPCFATYDDGYCCFTCGKKKAGAYEFKPKSELASNSLELPENTTVISQFSTTVLEWLYGYHVYESLIRQHKIAFVPYKEFQTPRGTKFSGEGLLFPVYVNDVLKLYQWRFFPNKQFITKGDKSVIHINHSPNVGKKVLVICEDFISSIRLGEFVDTMCLFGTSLHNEKLMYAVKFYTHIIVWLDSDVPGQTQADKIVGQFNYIVRKWPLRPFKIVNRRYKQPKECTNTEIKTSIEDILCESL